MRRPPLQELPLHQFLPVAQDNKQHQVRMNKRPLSPGATPVISPAKRRNLAAQDVFPPEATFRNSFTSPARFRQVLAGPASPAKVLDFGLPKHLVGDPEKRLLAEHVTPTRPQPSSSRLAPSPELKPQVVRPTRHDAVADVFFDSPIARPQSSSSTSSDTSYILIPREMPPRLDPHSIHYPGFAVYQDPHFVALKSAPEEVSRDLEDDESCKENVYIPPVAKGMATPRGSNLYKAAPETDRMSTPGRFKPVLSGRTPRPIPPSSSLGTPYKSDATASLDRKKNFRRRLQDELDFEEDGDIGDE